VPESVEGKDCQTELNQLRCLPCATDMKGRARLWPPLSDDKPDRRKSGVEDVELELCPDYCARLYSACKEALVVTSGVKVRQHYPSSSVFCRQHFRELFDVRLQTEAGLCYPVAPGLLFPIPLELNLVATLSAHNRPSRRVQAASMRPWGASTRRA
jgi:hypothetical protein